MKVQLSVKQLFVFVINDHFNVLFEKYCRNFVLCEFK